LSSTRYFVSNGREFVNIDEFLAKELDKAGYGLVELHKTPMGHRVVIHAMRLGMVIGKAGRNIKRLTEDLELVFGLESPQLEVKELENPDLVARVQASKLLSQIERGFHFRRAGHSLIRRIMATGARGVEIVISGKLSSQRSRSEAFRAGFVAKAGYPAQTFVDEYVSSTPLKQGVIGIKVRIMSPDADLPDEPIFYDLPIEEIIEEEKIEEIITKDTEVVEDKPGEIEEVFEGDDVFQEEETDTSEIIEAPKDEAKTDTSEIIEAPKDEAKTDTSETIEVPKDEAKTDTSETIEAPKDEEKTDENKENNDEKKEED
jgi:small subunit ribosomal protein S3